MNGIGGNGFMTIFDRKDRQGAFALMAAPRRKH